MTPAYAVKVITSFYFFLFKNIIRLSLSFYLFLMFFLFIFWWGKRLHFFHIHSLRMNYWLDLQL